MGKGLVLNDIIEKKKTDWNLKIIAGKSGTTNLVRVSDINRPGLALAGYMDYFANERIQVLGKTELSYLHTLSSVQRKKIFEDLS